MRFPQNEMYLSFNFSLVLFIHVIVLNVPWFSKHAIIPIKKNKVPLRAMKTFIRKKMGYTT